MRSHRIPTGMAAPASRSAADSLSSDKVGRPATALCGGCA